MQINSLRRFTEKTLAKRTSLPFSKWPFLSDGSFATAVATLRFLRGGLGGVDGVQVCVTRWVKALCFDSWNRCLIVVIARCDFLWAFLFLPDITERWNRFLSWHFYLIQLLHIRTHFKVNVKVPNSMAKSEWLFFHSCSCSIFILTFKDTCNHIKEVRTWYNEFQKAQVDFVCIPAFSGIAITCAFISFFHVSSLFVFRGDKTADVFRSSLPRISSSRCK